MSRSTGVVCSGVLGGRGLDLTCDDLGRLVDFFDLVEATEEEEMETFDVGRVEFDPLDELLLPTLFLLPPLRGRLRVHCHVCRHVRQHA